MYAPRNTLLSIYNSFIQAHFNYCDIVWHSGLNQEQSERLKKLQNREAWVIPHAGYEIRSSDLLMLNLDGIIYILVEYIIQA